MRQAAVGHSCAAVSGLVRIEPRRAGVQPLPEAPGGRLAVGEANANGALACELRAPRDVGRLDRLRLDDEDRSPAHLLRLRRARPSDVER
jgi:hypothetical protein